MSLCNDGWSPVIGCPSGLSRWVLGLTVPQRIMLELTDSPRALLPVLGRAQGWCVLTHCIQSVGQDWVPAAVESICPGPCFSGKSAYLPVLQVRCELFSNSIAQTELV